MKEPLIVHLERTAEARINTARGFIGMCLAHYRQISSMMAEEGADEDTIIALDGQIAKMEYLAGCICKTRNIIGRSIKRHINNLNSEEL